MSRIIRTKSGAAERKSLLQQLQAAGAVIGESQPELDELWDLLSFMALKLAEIQTSVEATVEAWEKRDYWLKAERFRTDWLWVNSLLSRVELMLAESESKASSRDIDQILADLGKQPAQKAKLQGRPWEGAHKAWHAKRGARGK